MYSMFRHLILLIDLLAGVMFKLPTLNYLDHLCGLVFRVPGYRSKGPGFDFRRYQIF
jgi:hypothetical protein